MQTKKCCFIGHRKIELTEKQKNKIKETIENLILNENVKIFIFGSRSDFNTLCHSTVTKLKEKYPDIKRIGYTCKSESVILESERDKFEKLYSHFKILKTHLLGVEEEFEHKTKFTAGKAAYIERNEAMIDDCDYCLFYYDENYHPPKRKHSKSCPFYYQPKSGTEIAYKYAKQKEKIIINFFNC